MKYSPKLSVLLSISLFTGCVTTSSTPSLPQLPGTKPTPQEVLHGNEAGFWKISPIEQTQTYSTFLTTVITQAEVLPVRRDSVAARALYSIKTIRSSDTIFYSGSITSFTIQRNTQDSEPTSLTSPILFSGKLSNHNISTTLFDPGSTQKQLNCDNIAQASLKSIQRIVIVLPTQISPGQTWTDSTSSPTCSGGLPIAGTVIRTFTTVGESQWEGVPALVLHESERTFSQGEGSQGQHQIVIRTEGSTNGQVYIDRSSGQFLAADIHNSTSVSIKSSGRVQHFTQTSTEVTQAIR